MATDRFLDSTQKVAAVIEALKAGRLIVRQEDGPWVQELLALPRNVTGMVDISSLEPETLAIARSTALSLSFFQQEDRKDSDSTALEMHDAQCRLFQHFEALFVSLIGVTSSDVNSIDEIKVRLMDRVARGNDIAFAKYREEADDLAQFYAQNAESIYTTAKALGGVKVVGGGQRYFGSNALAATRVGGLYCDTQLIPDPVYPYLHGHLHLNARELQLAIVLFHILALRPLADARLPVPPILVFPSFEEGLDKNDVVTQFGIGSLMVKVVGPACNAELTTIEELQEFAQTHEDAFLEVVSREKFLIPQGVDPEKVGTAREAASIYLKNLEGIRSEKVLSIMRKLPCGVLVFNGILERLRPVYHLIENAEELSAQPFLIQRSHWYYFERCVHAEASQLVNERVLSRDSLSILRALQDDSLTWLANIPIEGLAELRRNGEHAELREHLKKCTAQLTSAGPVELEAVTKEVRHGLEVLIQRQQKAIHEIEAKYAPKKWAAVTGGALGMAAGATMLFMPALAVAAGVAVPVASVLTGLASGGVAYAKEKVGEAIDKRTARRSMLGLLAIAHESKK